MMDLTEIEREIAKIEAAPDSYSKLERLNLLYQIRDRQGANKSQARANYSRAPAKVTEFSTLAESVPVEKLIDVLSDHMTVMQQIYPKEYASIMRRLSE